MAERECGYSPYLIPRLYVEGYPSDEYLVRSASGTLVAVTECSQEPCYGKAVYGTLLDEIVDLLAKKAKRSFVTVLPPDYSKGILVPRGATLEPVPVEGMRTTIVVCEGSEIKPGDTIGYIVTRKYELRHIRSHVEGVVVYIYSAPESKPDRNIVFIAPVDGVEKVHVQPRRG